jgi:hypothetical protein
MMKKPTATSNDQRAIQPTRIEHQDDGGFSIMGNSSVISMAGYPTKLWRYRTNQIMGI